MCCWSANEASKWLLILNGLAIGLFIKKQNITYVMSVPRYIGFRLKINKYKLDGD